MGFFDIFRNNWTVEREDGVTLRHVSEAKAVRYAFYRALYSKIPLIRHFYPEKRLIKLERMDH